MKQYLDVAKGVVLLAFLGVCGYFVWNYNRMEGEVAQIAPLQAQVEALQKQQQTLASETITRDKLSAAIRAERQSVVVRIDKVHTDDPQVRAYLDERIPDSLRRAHLGEPAGRQSVPAADGH